MRSAVCTILLLAIPACSGGSESQRDDRKDKIALEGERFEKETKPSQECLAQWRDIATSGCRADVAKHFEQDEEAEAKWRLAAKVVDDECTIPASVMNLRKMASKRVISHFEGDNPYGTSDEWCAFNVEDVGVRQRLLPASIRTVSAPVDENARRESEEYRQRVEETQSKEEGPANKRTESSRSFAYFVDIMLGKHGVWQCVGPWSDYGAESIQITVEEKWVFASTSRGKYTLNDVTQRRNYTGDSPVMDFESVSLSAAPRNFTLVAHRLEFGDGEFSFAAKPSDERFICKSAAR